MKNRNHQFLTLILLLAICCFACGGSSASNSTSSGATSDLATPSLIFSEDDGGTEFIPLIASRLCEGSQDGNTQNDAGNCSLVCKPEGGVSDTFINSAFEQYGSIAQKLIDYLDQNQCAEKRNTPTPTPTPRR